MKKDCVNCLYMATHEKCGTPGEPSECLHTPKDWEGMRKPGRLSDMPMRYLHHVESGPIEQMARLHALEVKGDRNILLGPGEAEVNIKDTPQQVSDNLHMVAEACGYMCDRLNHDGDKTSLVIYKDHGPFRIEWEGGKLARVLRVRNDGKTFRGVVWMATREAWQGKEVKA